MKKTIVCFVLAFVMLLIAFPTFADTRYDIGGYEGHCVNNFTCSQTWNMIYDNTLQDTNTYARLGSAAGTNVYYNSRFRIVLTSTGESVYHYKKNYSGATHVWTNNQGYQGKCSLRITNSYHAGATLYAKGSFAIF